jgi:ketosteroid isomerase-like protein
MATDDARTRAAVDRFNDAFDRHDVDAVMDAMTDDCVFESTAPPLGVRHRGQEAVRAAWEAFFAASPTARFEVEETIVCGARCVVRWRYTWTGADHSPGVVRGVDVLTVRDDKVAEKLSYVKG